MNDFFEFLGFQNAMKQSANNESLGDLTNDLIMNGNYYNTMDLNSGLVNIVLEKDK